MKPLVVHRQMIDDRCRFESPRTFPVLLDAAFAQRWQRCALARTLAVDSGAGWSAARARTLAARIRARLAAQRP
jgi:predicted kinase